jgi:hypothetical protein
MLYMGTSQNLVNVSFTENNNLHLQDPKVKEFIAAQGVDFWCMNLPRGSPAYEPSK